MDLFNDWIIEETPMQKNQTALRKKIQDYDEKNKIIIQNFNGYVNKIAEFITTINDQNDSELCDICVKLYPKLFINDSKTLKMKDIDVHGLTKDQNKAIEQFFNFMLNDKKKTFGLYGFSGTGKTTITVEMVSYLVKHRLIRSVAFCAPTNKAVNVMKMKFEGRAQEIYKFFTGKDENDDDDILWKLYDLGAKIDFMTVHRLLNFENEIDSNGNSIFKISKKKPEIDCYDLVIIDECSMLPMTMIEIVFGEICKAENAKVIFTGDSAQLPPVNEKCSVIFTKKKEEFDFNSYLKCHGISQNLIEKNIHDGNVFDKNKMDKLQKNYNFMINAIISMEYFIMEKVVRCKSNNVVGTCNVMRNYTLGKIKNPNISEHINETDCIAYEFDTKTPKIKTNWFKKFLTGNIQDNIILTWTNFQCDMYNETARKHLFNKEKLERFQEGEILMLTDYYNTKNTNKDVFYTSEQVKVIKIEIIEKKLGMFKETIDKRRLANADYHEKHYKNTINMITKNVKQSVLCWKLTVTRMFDKSNETLILYVLHENIINEYNKQLEFIMNCIKKLKITLTTKQIDKTGSIENNVIKPLWNDFYKIYNSPFANVNYGYSITTHKAQGSTFFNVYVDMDDIMKNKNENEMKRCLYTALSRTSNELHMLI